MEFDITKLIKIIGTIDNINNYSFNTNFLEFSVKDLAKIEILELNKLKNLESFSIKSNTLFVKTQENIEIDDCLKKMENLLLKRKKEKSKIRILFDKSIKSITGSLNPAVPLLAGAGMGKVLLKVLELLDILQKGNPNYDILKFVFDTPFYFLPVIVGVSAGKIFKTNRMLAVFVGLMLVHPTFVQMVKAGNPISFLGLSMPLYKYSAQIIPAILSIWVLSYIERFFNKYIPETIKLFTVPLLSILIIAPLTFLFIAPLGYSMGDYIAKVVLWSSSRFGFIAIAILAAIYPWLVTAGLHKALSPVSIMLVAEQGFDPIIRTIALCSNIAQASSCLAISIKAKNKNLKAIAKAGAITAMLGGYTETALYGVNLKLKRPMFACMIGAFVSGCYAGFIGIKAYVYITPAILSLPMWIGDHGNYIYHAIITLFISIIVTFIATLLIGFDENEYDETSEE